MSDSKTPADDKNADSYIIKDIRTNPDADRLVSAFIALPDPVKDLSICKVTDLGCLPLKPSTPK